MWQDAHDVYLESRVMAADPVELVAMLYQASSGAVRDARRYLAEGDIAARSKSITRAQEILLELAGSLDPKAGEISARLGSLYSYMLERLLDANLRQVDEPLAEVLGLLATLEEAWSGVSRETKPAPQAESRWGQAMPFDAAPEVAHAWSF
jgi:flagellar protein FliS